MRKINKDKLTYTYVEVIKKKDMEQQIDNIQYSVYMTQAIVYKLIRMPK